MYEFNHSSHDDEPPATGGRFASLRPRKPRSPASLALVPDPETPVVRAIPGGFVFKVCGRHAMQFVPSCFVMHSDGLRAVFPLRHLDDDGDGELDPCEEVEVYLPTVGPIRRGEPVEVTWDESRTLAGVRSFVRHHVYALPCGGEGRL